MTLKRHSDPLLLTLLKRYDPAFGDKVQVDTHATVDIQAHRALIQLPTTDLEVLKKYIDAAEMPVIDVHVEEEEDDDVDSGSD